MQRERNLQVVRACVGVREKKKSGSIFKVCCSANRVAGRRGGGLRLVGCEAGAASDGSGDYNVSAVSRWSPSAADVWLAKGRVISDIFISSLGRYTIFVYGCSIEGHRVISHYFSVTVKVNQIFRTSKILSEL